MRPPQSSRRIGIAALIVVASAGFAVALGSYVRYAGVWLRKPPQLHPCAFVARQGLLHEEPVTGSIPFVTDKGETVYLRKSEDRAVRCMERMSKEASKKLAVAFAEVEPVARARGLLAVLRDDVSTDRSTDREAVATYLFAAAAMRPLPKDEATTAARDELDRLNACRFSMRTPCPTRPPVPLVVWAAGVPSSLVLLTGLGAGVAALVSRLRARRRKAAETKAAAKAKAQSEEEVCRDEVGPPA